MAEDLLLTKLFRPGLRPDHVPRPAVVARLVAGLADGKILTLISAPAGYGKTALANEWLAAQERPVAWLSLDEGDDSLAHFLRYLTRALQTLDPPLTGRLPERLKAPKLDAPEKLATTLINDLLVHPAGESVRLPFILVLDDLHRVTAPEIFTFLDLLIDQAPPPLHLVLVTRRDPPLALARLRVRDVLTEVRQRDLRFGDAEARRFLEKQLAIPLTAEETGRLNERVEGWVAGLQLAALSLRDLPADERERLIAGFSGRHRFILDYLTNEVLRRQPPEIERFLLHTAILEQMCGPLCATLLAPGADAGGETPVAVDGQQLLETLDVANLFLVRLDNERRWYRYHTLFGELLRARLRATDPALVPVLHRRAAEWFAQAGHMPQAVHHTLQAGDPEQAAVVVEQAILTVSTWSQVETNELMRWMEALPAGVVTRRPWLRLFRSRALFVMGRTAEARRVLAELTAWLADSGAAQEGDRPEEADRILSLARLDRASYAVVDGDAEEGLAQAHLAMAALPADDQFSRLRIHALMALAHSRLGNVRQAETLLSDAAEQAQAVGMPVAAVPLLCNRAEVELIQGRLAEAGHTSEEALALGTVQGQEIAATGFAWLQLGKIAYYRDELAEAEKNLRHAIELLASAGIGESFGNAYGVLALIKQAQGDAAAANSEAQRGLEIAQASGIIRLVGQAQAYQARIWLAQGQTAPAAQWAEKFQEAPPVSYQQVFAELTLVRFLLAQEAGEEAGQLIRRRLPEAEAAGRWLHVLEMMLLRALIRQQNGDQEGALADMRRALDLARPEGIRRLFLNEGVPVVNLLKAVWKAGHAAEFVVDLLSGMDRPGDRARSGPTGQGAGGVEAGLVEPLTAREQEVLVELAGGKTSKEIAGELVLSPHTVRTHMYNLYGKLGVHNRMEAVNRARELGLLPD